MLVFSILWPDNLAFQGKNGSVLLLRHALVLPIHTSAEGPDFVHRDSFVKKLRVEPMTAKAGFSSDMYGGLGGLEG